MNIATIQMPMAYTISENIQTILQSLTKAKDMGADVAVFPECAVIGYHRNMGDGMSPHVIDQVLSQIGARCKSLGIAAVVGSPYYGGAAQVKPWNAMVVFDEAGQLCAVCPKLILTRTEKILDIFTVGSPDSRDCFRLFGRMCTVIICIELTGDIEKIHPHYRDILSSLKTSPEIVFVPGVLDMSEDSEVPNAYAARSMAKEFQTAVVIANWPEWGGPPAKGYMGRSLTIAANGEIICEAPPNQPDIILGKV
jgi:predicted amidohydrolase